MRLVVLAGLLWLAAASSAAAQPATFVVFFDWNRATLNAQGYQSVHQAAGIALQTGANVIVTGFTDTSGPIGYNNALSWRRIQTVVAELERAGIPPSALHAQGFGEAYPRLPTPDEIREPQNRRVQITVQRPIPISPPVLPYPYPMVSWPFGFGFTLGWAHGGWWGGYRH